MIKNKLYIQRYIITMHKIVDLSKEFSRLCIKKKKNVHRSEPYPASGIILICKDIKTPAKTNDIEMSYSPYPVRNLDFNKSK